MSVNITQFQQKLTYNNISKNIGEIFQDLDKIAQLDKWAEKKESQWQIILILSIIGIISSTFLIAFIPPLGIILLPVSIIMVIIGGIQVYKYNRLNIQNYRYEVTKKILTMVNRDRQGGSDINLQINFSASTAKEKCISTIDHPLRSGWKIQIFKDEWLTLTSIFLDGSNFNLTATNTYQIVSGWKRASSGKNKHKSKTKSKGTTINLTLDYPVNKYGALKILKNEAETAIKLPAGVLRKRLQITDKHIKLTAKMPNNSGENTETIYQTVTMMFLSIYQVLNLAKMLSKKTNK